MHGVEISAQEFLPCFPELLEDDMHDGMVEALWVRMRINKQMVHNVFLSGELPVIFNAQLLATDRLSQRQISLRVEVRAGELVLQKPVKTGCCDHCSIVRAERNGRDEHLYF